MSLKDEMSKICDMEKMERHDPALFKGMILGEYSSVGFEKKDVKDKQVIDIGANIGTFCGLCHFAGAKSIFAVEFNQENFSMLQENTARMNVACLRRAAFDGVRKLVGITGAGVTSKVGDSSFAVEALSLDEILIASGFEGNDLVLKIDIEGAEPDVLLSASGRTIRRFRTIFLETHPPWKKEPGRSTKFLTDYLSFLGFKVRKKELMFYWTWDANGNATGCQLIDDFENMSLDRIGG